MYARYITLASVLQRAQQKKRYFARLNPTIPSPIRMGFRLYFFGQRVARRGGLV